MSNQTKDKYLIPLAIIIAGVMIAGAIVWTKAPKFSLEPSQDSKTAQVLPQDDTVKKEVLKANLAIGEKDHIRGNPEAPITIVEFSDLQCPFCQRFHPTVQQILKDYPDKVRWVYKHFPLDQIHPNARPAAEASECVAEQKGNDGFWQFADSLFENQSRLGETLYKELAQSLGLNLAEFENCLSSRKYKDKVQADYQEGVKAGVRGTPGSFINGEEIPGAVPYEYLKEAVERTLGSL